jgi:hypothetical protein
MTPKERAEAFIVLGEYLKIMPPEEFSNWAFEARKNNAWFTENSVMTALRGIARMLEKEALNTWFSKYQTEKITHPKKVGVVMAGNIPLVGFHDFLCVLLSGHKLVAKTSSQDDVLIRKISKRLIKINESFSGEIEFVDKLSGIDAVIATGSDNSARYFKYYFSAIPHITRQNRASCAVLNGEETEQDLLDLGKDILLYFGMGCRNVSKIYVPEGYDFSRLLTCIELHRPIVDMNKYYNNFDYNKSIFIVNNIPHLDNGFLLLTESKDIVSPVSVVYYEYYSDRDDLKTKLNEKADKIQVLVSKRAWYPGSVQFGEAQFPSVSDYADRVDTMKFLIQL